MNIFNNVINGMSSQFGREFGRAAANSILKGANSYNINNISNTSGRIKPSDTDVVKSIKSINKINFVSTNKGNTSKLILIVNHAIDGVDDTLTLENLNDVLYLNKIYSNKIEHGEALIDDDYNGKEVDLLSRKIEEYENLVDSYVNRCKIIIKASKSVTERERKTKKNAILLSILSFFILGYPFQEIYLENKNIWQIMKWVILTLLFCWILPLFSLYYIVKYTFMSQEKIDNRYNGEYLYYKNFNLK